MVRLRRLPFLLACLSLILSMGIEGGTGCLISHQAPGAERLAAAIAGKADPAPDVQQLSRDAAGRDPPKGLGTPALAVLDGLCLLTIGLFAASVVFPARIMGRVQAPIRLVIALSITLGGLKLLLSSIAQLLLMVGLLLATPFGTIVYIALWGFFDTAASTGLLSLVMLFKLVFVICLVAAHQSFLKGKMLVALIATSLLATLLVSFLHSLFPSFLVSITDAVGAIITAVLTLIWGLIVVIGSILPTIKSLRFEHESS